MIAASHLLIAVSLLMALTGCICKTVPSPRAPAPTPGADVVEVNIDIPVPERDDWKIFNRTAQAILDAREIFMYQPRDTERYVAGRWVDIDVCPLGSVHLNSLIHQSGASSIFDASLLWEDRGIAHIRSVVVKHANNCPEVVTRGRKARSLLVIEAVFMHVLSPFKLAPDPLFLSRPTVLQSVTGLPARVQSPYLLANSMHCLTMNTETRYLIEEKAGVDLFVYFDHLQNTTGWLEVAERAVGIAIRIVEMLKSLHRLGMVHGDIHGGNVLFKSPYSSPDQVPLTDSELVFVDFEYALFYPPTMGRPVEDTDRRSMTPVWLSPWQLLRQRLGRRDDVYRVMDWLADTLSLGARYQYLIAQIDRARRYGVRDVDLSGFKDASAMFSCMAPNASDAVRAVLDHIARSHLASYDHPDHRPDYDEIVVQLRTVSELLSNHSHSSSTQSQPLLT